MPIVVSRRTVLGGAVSAALLPALASDAIAATGRAKRRALSDPSGSGKPRFMHTATALSDGRVLLAGGFHERPDWRSGSNPLPSTSVEIYDPAREAWFHAAPMTSPRARHAAVLLPDGRVAVLGGFVTAPVDSVEIYDPYSDTWTRANPLPRSMCDHAACAVGSQIFLSGGGLGVPALKHTITAAPSRPVP